MSTDSFDDVPFTLDDVDPDHVEGSGVSLLPEGGYRVTITEVIVQNQRASTEVKCEVVRAKDDTLVARRHNEYLKWPKTEYSETGNRIAKEQLLAWCFAAKTTSPAEIKVRQQAGQGFTSAWLEKMVGRDVLIYVKRDKYTDANGNEKESAKAEGRVWAIDSPKGSSIPGYEPAPNPTPATTNQAELSQQQSAQPAAASSSFSDLV